MSADTAAPVLRFEQQRIARGRTVHSAGALFLADALYVHVTERMRSVPITTADQLVTTVTTWGYLVVTRPGWIPRELSLSGSAAPSRSGPLTRLISALGGWLSAAAETIGVQAADMLMSLLAGLIARHLDPIDITAAQVRHRVECVLFDTVIPRRFAGAGHGQEAITPIPV